VLNRALLLVARRKCDRRQPRSDQGCPSRVKVLELGVCRRISSRRGHRCCWRRHLASRGGCEPYSGYGCIWCWMIPKRDDRDAAARCLAQAQTTRLEGKLRPVPPVALRMPSFAATVQRGPAPEKEQRGRDPGPVPQGAAAFRRDRLTWGWRFCAALLTMLFSVIAIRLDTHTADVVQRLRIAVTAQRRLHRSPSLATDQFKAAPGWAAGRPRWPLRSIGAGARPAVISSRGIQPPHQGRSGVRCRLAGGWPPTANNAG